MNPHTQTEKAMAPEFVANGRAIGRDRRTTAASVSAPMLQNAGPKSLLDLNP
jgi:hypothetical protein